MDLNAAEEQIKQNQAKREANFHSQHPSVAQAFGRADSARRKLVAMASSNEEPFRVIGNEARLFRNKTLTEPSDEPPIENEAIFSGQYVNNNVVFVGDPYMQYTSAHDVEPLDITHKRAPDAPMGVFDEDAENEYGDDNVEVIKNRANNAGGASPAGGGDRPPQSFEAPQPQDFGNAERFDRFNNGFDRMEPPSNASNGSNGNRGPAGGPQRPNSHTELPAAVDARHAIHGISYTDQNGLQQHIGLNQENMLTNVLGRPQQGGGAATAGMHASQMSGMSQHSHYSQGGPQRPGMRGQGGPDFVNFQMGRRGSDSQGSHVSSRSRTHSHRSHRSHRSGMGNGMDDDLIEDAPSEYSVGDDYEPSVGTFVPLPRQKAEGDGPLKMNYKKGFGHSIPKSQLKSPMIYNQIANDICIKRSKNRGGPKKIKDNIIITKFPDARPLLDRDYFSMSHGVRGGLVVVIPFFNEPAIELENTLTYLHSTYTWMCETDPVWQNRPMDICMIQDGWFKASDSMQKYLKKMFPKQYYIDPSSGKEVDRPAEDDPMKTAGSVSDQETDDEDEKNVMDGADGTGHDRAGSVVSGLSSASKKKGAGKAKSEASFAGTALPEVSKYWWEYLPEFIDYDKKRDGSVTYVFEKTHDNPSYFELKFRPNANGKIDKRMEVQKHFRVTLIVKIDNRRKHNSHEWFLGENGFADAYNARYLFATDAFTLFEPPCMYHMVHYLDTHPDTAAVTGRQRAMNRKQQHKAGVEFILSIEFMLRMTQTFDFELTSGVFNPVYGVCGFLPVIPGPCGLYRCSDVGQNKARYWYFDIVNAEPTETGLILGNLRIAEDRILTYASILKVKDYRRMAFCPAGLFFFECEVDLGPFIFQRRRWINGTFAGFIYILIAAPYHVWGWHANFWVKFKVWLLLVINFAQLSTVVLSPAISFSILNTSLSYLLFWFTDQALSLADNIMLFGWILWVLHVIIHNTAKFSQTIIKLLYAWSFLISCSLVVTYFLLFIIEGKDIYEGLLVKGMKPEELDFVLGLMAFGSVVPFSCQYMVGGWEAVIILGQSVIQYFLSFHLMIPWFTSYAFARCWDLTWGNRPAEGEMDEVEAEKFEAAEIMKAKFLQYSRLVALAMILCNIGLFLLPPYYIILTMSGFLMATAFFMGSSFIVLLTQTFCGEWLTNLLSRSLEEYRKSEQREREQLQMYGNLDAVGNNNFNAINDGTNNRDPNRSQRGDNEEEEEYYSESDDEYVVIPQEYQAQAAIPARHLGPNFDENGNQDTYGGDEYDNGYYDENGVWVDYDPKNASHNNFQPSVVGDPSDFLGNGYSNVDNGGANGDDYQDDGQGGYYDDNGNWVDDYTGGQGGYYDDDGNWIEDDANGGQGYEYDQGYVPPTGGTTGGAQGDQGGYDENGDYYDENGGYYDDNGNYVDANGGYYDENGVYVDPNDPNGGYDDNYGAQGGY